MRCISLAAMLLAGCSGSPASSSDHSVAHTQAGDVRLTARVVDQADLLPPATEKELAARSQALEKDTTDQLVVVTLPSLKGAPVDAVGRELGNGWGLGQKQLDNGVVVLIAPAERKVRIAVGYGLEGLLTHDKSAGIVKDMLPLLQARRWSNAAELGVGEIVTVLEADKRRPQRHEQRKAA